MQKRRIKGSILDEVRKASSMSRLAVKNNREYSHAKMSLTNSLGREPSNQEVAELLGLTISELERKRSHANQFNLVQIDDESIQTEADLKIKQRTHYLAWRIQNYLIDLRMKYQSLTIDLS